MSRPLDTEIEHTVGNAIFAIETSLESLKRRIKDGRTEEALEIVNALGNSVEKAKIGLDKWKNHNKLEDTLDFLAGLKKK